MGREMYSINEMKMIRFPHPKEGCGELNKGA